MTTIAFRDGVVAADSRCTFEGEASGTMFATCQKLYRVKGSIIGLQGDSYPGLVFLDWYKSGRKTAPDGLILSETADFFALVLDKNGLWLFDKWCRGEKVLDEFFAIGSGCKAALGALHAGATAERAVEIACKIDPFTAPPIVTMKL